MGLLDELLGGMMGDDSRRTPGQGATRPPASGGGVGGVMTALLPVLLSMLASRGSGAGRSGGGLGDVLGQVLGGGVRSGTGGGLGVFSAAPGRLAAWGRSVASSSR